MTPLFSELRLDQLDTDYRNWLSRFPDVGLRMSILLYRPTGAIDIVLHKARRPSASALRKLATQHLLDAPAGTMQ